LRIAAIDIGSNSIHMIIAQVEADGGMVSIARLKEMTGLAAAAFPKHLLPRDSIERAMLVLGRFKQAALDRKCEKIRCVATSAVRESNNGGDFLQRIKDELNLNAKIISGREEARLIYLGVRHAVQLNSNTLILDIGGGSAEFIIGDAHQASLLESRKLGASRMTTQFVKTDPISEEDVAAIRAHYERELAPVCEQILHHSPNRAIGTSGTLEAVAALTAPYAKDRESNGEEKDAIAIERGPFQELLEKLLKSSAEQREKIPDLDPHRRNQIVAGALLVDELFRRLKLKRIEITKSALREGIVVDYLARNIPEMTIRQRIPEPRRRSVIGLARRCAWHKNHSEQVAKLCLNLFDQLRSLHGLDNRARELIDYGALLHDIGWHIAQNGHHKHSMYLIFNGDLEGFTEEEIQIIANIARYHRKSTPKRKHAGFQKLPPQARRIVCVGAALLRLADGLDRSHASVVESVRCRTTAAQVKCTVITRLDAELEIWGANRKREMFEAVLQRPIVFELARS
jgi:exopolyphosphatase/guanosine-5'-triphosphate,3'-diphosphate pyrophosphatase